MQANFLSLLTPLRSKAKTIFFLKVVMLHIKFMGMEHIEHHTSIYSVLTLGWGEKVKTFFFTECGHVAYQIKGNGT